MNALDLLAFGLLIIVGGAAGILAARVVARLLFDPKEAEIRRNWGLLDEQRVRSDKALEDARASIDRSTAITDELAAKEADGWRLRWVQPRKRAPAIADPRAAYEAAVSALKVSNTRLSKLNIATEMGIDRSTLDRYIAEYELRFPPI